MSCDIEFDEKCTVDFDNEGNPIKDSVAVDLISKMDLTDIDPDDRIKVDCGKTKYCQDMGSLYAWWLASQRKKDFVHPYTQQPFSKSGMGKLTEYEKKKDLNYRTLHDTDVFLNKFCQIVGQLDLSKFVYNKDIINLIFFDKQLDPKKKERVIKCLLDAGLNLNDMYNYELGFKLTKLVDNITPETLKIIHEKEPFDNYFIGKHFFDISRPDQYIYSITYINDYINKKYSELSYAEKVPEYERMRKTLLDLAFYFMANSDILLSNNRVSNDRWNDWKKNYDAEFRIPKEEIYNKYSSKINEKLKQIGNKNLMTK